MLTVIAKSSIAPVSIWYVLLVMAMVYPARVDDIGALERLPTANETIEPEDVILFRLPVITVPVPVPEEEEKYRTKVRGAVRVVFPANAGCE